MKIKRVCMALLLYGSNICAMDILDDVHFERLSYMSETIDEGEVAEGALEDIESLSEWFFYKFDSLYNIDFFLDNQITFDQRDTDNEDTEIECLQLDGDIYEGQSIDFRRIFSRKLRRCKSFPNVRKLTMNVRQLCDKRVRSRLFSKNFSVDTLEDLNVYGTLNKNSKLILSEFLDTSINLKELNISKVGLTGWLKSIDNLLNLESLNISFNKLTILSRSIRKLKKLKILNIEHNELTYLPDDIGELNYLEKLNINHNEITALPESIKQIKTLKSLNVEHNFINVPMYIGDLQDLEELNFSYNFLKSIPKVIGKLKKLNKLLLNNNALKVVPAEIGELSKLEQLDLSNNFITELSPKFWKLVNLKFLNLGFNHLKEISTDILYMQDLENLYLDNNLFEYKCWRKHKLKTAEQMNSLNHKDLTVSKMIVQLPRLKELRIDRNCVSRLPKNIDIEKNIQLVLNLIFVGKHRQNLSKYHQNKLLDDINIHKELMVKINGNRASRMTVYLKQIDSNTSIHELISCGNFSSIQWLLDNRDVNLKAKDHTGKTALQVAKKELKKYKKRRNKKKTYQEIIDCLQQHGASI